MLPSSTGHHRCTFRAARRAAPRRRWRGSSTSQLL
eukprot:gene2806-4387_t